MAVAVSEIMTRASHVLSDTAAVRWTPQQMLLWVNDGQRSIVLNKPTANAETVSISLSAGVEQTIPATAHQLIRILRNTGGAAIRMVDRDIMDAHVPGWGDTSIWPAQAVVEHAIYDLASPDTFDVFPANDGNGAVDAVVSTLPDDLPEPASPELIASYTANIGIGDEWRACLLDYVLYRAFSNDAEYPAAAQRAMAYYQTYASMVGIRGQIEARDNPDRTEGV